MIEQSDGAPVSISGHGCSVPERIVTDGEGRRANVRIAAHAVQKLGFPLEKGVVDADRFANTSPGSIPPVLGDDSADRRPQPGKLVLLTEMGAGIAWGSAPVEMDSTSDGVTR